MTRLISTTFRSLKPQFPKSPAISKSKSNPSPSVVSFESESQNLIINNWSVYLIVSTNPPIKTYVGVTNNFSRQIGSSDFVNKRLRQHNGELKGGAKASQAGRPWICACIIQGFESKSEACKFEYRWKNVSCKMSRKRKSEEGGLHLLQHRNAALEKVKDSIDCSHLGFDWKLAII